MSFAKNPLSVPSRHRGSTTHTKTPSSGPGCRSYHCVVFVRKDIWNRGHGGWLGVEIQAKSCHCHNARAHFKQHAHVVESVKGRRNTQIFFSQQRGGSESASGGKRRPPLAEWNFSVEPHGVVGLREDRFGPAGSTSRSFSLGPTNKRRCRCGDATRLWFPGRSGISWERTSLPLLHWETRSTRRNKFEKSKAPLGRGWST